MADEERTGRIREADFRRLASQMGSPLSDALLVPIFNKSKQSNRLGRGGGGKAREMDENNRPAAFW